MECYFIFGFLSIVAADQNKRSDLVEYAFEVTNKYYKRALITSVVWTNESEAIDSFLIKYPGSVLITRLFDNNNSVILKTIENFRYQQAIFFTSEPEIFEQSISLISKNARHPVRIVLVVEKPIRKLLDLLIFTKAAWKNGLVDIVIISENYNDEIIISTFYPYSNGVCGNDIPVQINPGENMFPNKFSNFHKCPIRLTALPFLPYVDTNETKSENGIITGIGGYDGITFSYLAQNLNATLNIKLETYNEGLWNNTYGTVRGNIATGSFSDLVYNKADMLIPAGMLTLARYSVVQVSHMYHTLDIRWIGPKRKEIYHGLKLLLPFMNIVTPVLCLSYIIFIVVANLIRKFKSFNRDERKKSISYQSFALLLGQTANYETKITFLNNFFLIWIWFCFIVRIVYQADLVQSLQNELLEPPFTTIEEAVGRVDGYGGSQVILENYHNTPLENNFKILGLTDLKRYLENIAHGERFMIATDTFLIHHMRHAYQVLDTQVSSTSACLFMRRGWAPAQTVDSVINRLVESGIVEKIRYDNKAEPQQGINRNDKVHPLDLAMLCSCFYGLAIMSVLCFAILLIEIIYAKYACLKCK